MKFYDCLTAPSPRRVRMFIAEKGLTIPTTLIDLANGEHLSESFLKVNPHATVPVLELDDGKCLLDSFAICTYLEAVHPEPNLMGSTPSEKGLVAQWQREMDWNGLMAIADCFRNSTKGFVNRAMTGPANYAQIPELADRSRHRVRRFLSDLDRQLGTSEYVALDRFTIADITGIVAIDFARAIKETIPNDARNIARWRASVSARPSARL